MREIEVNGELGVFVPYIWLIIIGLTIGILLGVTAWSIDHGLGIDEKIEPILKENERLREICVMNDDHYNPNAWVIDVNI